MIDDEGRKKNSIGKNYWINSAMHPSIMGSFKLYINREVEPSGPKPKLFSDIHQTKCDFFLTSFLSPKIK